MEKEGEPPDSELKRKIILFYQQTIKRDCSGREIKDFLTKLDRMVFASFHNDGTYDGFENCSGFDRYIKDEVHFRLEDNHFVFDNKGGYFIGLDGKIYEEMKDRVIRAIVGRAISGRALNESLKDDVSLISNDKVDLGFRRDYGFSRPYSEISPPY